MNKWTVTYLNLVFFFGYVPVHGYPNMIRHGYHQCLNCHISPTGNGLLTPHGQATSSTVLSMFGEPEEGTAFWGAFPSNKTFSLGGKIRAMEYLVSKAATRYGKFRLLQADLDGMLTFKNMRMVANLGMSPLSGTHSFKEQIFSRRHFLSIPLNEKLNLRVGKFYPNFGLGFIDYTVWVRSQLGYHRDSESYHLEIGFIENEFNVYLTARAGRVDQSDSMDDKGVILQGQFLADKYLLLGAGAWYGTHDIYDRFIVNGFGLWGITRQLYLELELDYQRKLIKALNETELSWITWSQLGYEITQGLHYLLTLEFKNESTVRNSGNGLSYGLGIQWFPRPHFEFLVSLKKISTHEPAQDLTSLTVLAHVYF